MKNSNFSLLKLPKYDSSQYSIFTAKGISNIIIGVTLFSIFIGIFFFTYAVKIEKEILNIQIRHLIDNMTNDLQQFTSVKEWIKNYVSKIEIPDLSEEDDKINSQNAIIINNAKKTLFIFGVVSIILVTFICVIFKVNIIDVIITNILLLVFIGITEVFFLNFVAKRYLSLDPNKVKVKIIEELQKFKYT